MSATFTLPPQQRLLKKNAIVTGGANGIGAAIVEAFVKQGANVAVFDIASFDAIKSRMSSLQKTLRSSSLFCPDVFYLKCDVSNETEVRDSINKLVKNNSYFGSQIDILVNNAAKFVLKSVVSAEREDWMQSINVNILGYVNTMKHCLRNDNMRKTPKSHASNIINISSVSAQVAQPNMATYSMCKAATVSLTRNSSLDLYGKYGIRVNCICPGTIYTDASEKEMKIQGWSREEWEVVKMTNAIMQRAGRPEEIAMAAVFFASEEASFCTGSVLNVDGGWSTL